MSETRPAECATNKSVDVCSVGNMCVDIMLQTRLPVRSGEHQRLREGARLALGGSLNCLIAAARFGAKAAAVGFVGEVREGSQVAGETVFTKFLLSAASETGISTAGLVQSVGVQTPTCAALIEYSGGHTFLASNEELDETTRERSQPLTAAMARVITMSRALVVDGYALTSDRDVVSAALDIATAAGTEVWMDPQAASGSLQSDDLFCRVFSLAHGVSLTEDEGFTLTGSRDAAQIASSLTRSFCPRAKVILVKRGSRGCAVVSGNKVRVVAGFCIEDRYKDSIGAGDSFLGAFLASPGLGLSHEQSALLANGMGAATCLQHGAGENGVGSLDCLLEVLRLTEEGRALGLELKRRNSVFAR